MDLTKEAIEAFGYFLPDLFAATMIADEKDRLRIRKLGEVCRKHDVPFTKYMAILQEYTKWEESL